MLDISFLNKTPDFHFQHAGMEFMELQKGDAFRSFTEFLDKLIRPGKGPEVSELILDWDQADREDFSALILRETGILFDVKEGKNIVANASVNSGYFAPNHVLNNQGIDQWVDAKHTTIAAAFKSLKSDVIKGSVDLKTGKVCGGFSQIKFELYVQEYLDTWLRLKEMKKLNVSPAQALAGTLLHECGHVFTGFMMLERRSVDTLIPFMAAKMYSKVEDQKTKFEILKSSLQVLEVNDKVDKDVTDYVDEENIILYFNKMLESRNLKRTLSLGTTTRMSEVYADMYAIKMGAGKSIVAALSTKVSILPAWEYALMIGLPIMLLGAMGIQAIGMVPLLVMGSFIFGMEFTANLIPGVDYDSPWRRAKTMLRFHVDEIANNKDLKGAEKVKMVKEAKELEKYIDDNKPLLEGTAIQRLWGWMTSGADFKAQDFEHYTQELISHNLSLYIDHFKKEA